MRVSFKSSQIENPQTAVQERKDGMGVFDTSREFWKGTLKGYEGAKALTVGTAKGIKNAVYAGSALVALDWFGTSIARIAKNKPDATVWNMVKTPFVLAGKAIAKSSKYLVEFCKKDVPSIPQALKTMLIDTPVKIIKKVYKSPNISFVARYGLPVIALSVLGYSIVRSKLDYNERAARIDHRYGGVLGHHDK